MKLFSAAIIVTLLGSLAVGAATNSVGAKVETNSVTLVGETAAPRDARMA